MNELKKIIIEEIRTNGPMPLEDYMARALGDNTHGYYTKKNPFFSNFKKEGQNKFNKERHLRTN